MTKRRIGLAAFIVGTLGVFGGSGVAQASHAGALADCGSAGTFIIRATDIPSGFQAPDPSAVTLFEGGGTLTVMALSVNNQLIYSNAETGRAHRNVAEVTCTYTSGSGVLFTATGILTAR